ncbi:MAG: hypothetical protein WC323_03605 [Patescibacteria group bacterium]|jgi:tetrahydromethanopterin S-methyltransferase subunit G
MPKKGSAAKKPAKKKYRTAKRKVGIEEIAAEVYQTPENGLKIEREKIIAMWSAVGFFIIIIFTFWAVSFKNSIQNSVKDSSGGAEEFSGILSSFNVAIEEAKNNFVEIKDVVDAAKDGAAPSSDIKDQQIKELEDRLDEMEKKIELEKLLYKLNDELNKPE